MRPTDLEGGPDAAAVLAGLPGAVELYAPAIPSCVYVLIRAGEVVYVGQSVALYTRVEDHRRNKVFDSLWYYPVPLALLDQVEGALIRALRPPLNSGGPMGAPELDAAALKAVGITLPPQHRVPVRINLIRTLRQRNRLPSEMSRAVLRIWKRNEQRRLKKWAEDLERKRANRSAASRAAAAKRKAEKETGARS